MSFYRISLRRGAASLSLTSGLVLAACGSPHMNITNQSQTSAPTSSSPAPSSPTSSSPTSSGSASATNVAYIYVSSAAASGSGNEIQAFAASSEGALTPVSGSPFAGNVTQIAVSGSQMIGANSNGIDLESYAVGSSGALTHETTTNVSAASATGAGACNSLGPLFFDSTGATVYDMEYNGSDCANNTYASFTVGSNGALTALGTSSGNKWLSLPAAFASSNTYAYTASCNSDLYWGIYGFSRASNGLLTQINVNAAPPTPPAGHFYCPSLAATDSANHVAMVMQPVNQQSFNPDEPAQIAVYTAASNGGLTTVSTAANMPATKVGTVNDLKMSPSGTMLAVAGSTGLQVFDFNGTNPVSSGTGLLTSDSIDQCFWDSSGHLYALSRTAGKLHVFTVTSSGAVEVQGSPYAVAQPQNLAVLPAS